MPDLRRFHDAQHDTIDAALAELGSGAKRTHWMWWVFPQLRGLGRSGTARLYGLDGAAEARAYLADPVLRDRLERAVAAMMRHRNVPPERVLGPTDALKLRSSLTLFAAVDPDGPWRPALDALFDTPCPLTLDRL